MNSIYDHFKTLQAIFCLRVRKTQTLQDQIRLDYILNTLCSILYAQYFISSQLLLIHATSNEKLPFLGHLNIKNSCYFMPLIFMIFSKKVCQVSNLMLYAIWGEAC